MVNRKIFSCSGNADFETIGNLKLPIESRGGTEVMPKVSMAHYTLENY